jgi:PRC-barrel domain
MAAFDPATLERWRALAIVDRNGTTVGTISEFYLDRETGYPTWALVDTGLFGGNQTFVPLVHATEIDDGLQVPYEKRHIKDAPRVDLHDELTPDEEATLFGHYGVDYQPSPVAGSVEGSEPDAVPAEPGSVEGPGGGGVPGEPGSVDGPGPVPVEPGSVEGPGPVPVEPGSVDSPGGVPGEPESIGGPGGRTDRRGSVEGPGPLAAEPGSVEGPATVPAEPGSVEHRGAGPAAGTAEADEVTQVTPGGLAETYPEHPAGPDPSRTATDAHDFDQSRPAWGDNDPDPSRAAPSDPDLSRTAPVAPGLPGSTAASTSGPIPTTIDKGAGPDQDARPVEEPLQGPDEPGWPPATGSFEEPTPEERPVAASDRWREAKLAAERERIARTAAAQPEERSPLERARRRLERLVGGGQDHDAEGISPAERDAAERARRARLGLDEDDRRG